MRKRAIIGLAGLYAMAAVVTFGHSAALNDREYAECKALERADVLGDYCTYVSPVDAGVSAIVWPLYWSWEAFS